MQFLMNHHLNSFLEVLRVLKENDEKIELGNLKLMGNDLAKNSADIETSIDLLDLTQTSVNEEEVAEV